MVDSNDGAYSSTGSAVPTLGNSRRSISGLVIMVELLPADIPVRNSPVHGLRGDIYQLSTIFRHFPISFAKIFLMLS